MTLGYAARASSVLALLLPACVENTGIADNDRSSSPVVEVDSGRPEPVDAGDGDGDGSDAGPSKVEGTAPAAMCTSVSQINAERSNCFGFYCGTNEADILAETKAGGGCSTPEEVAQICLGHIAEVVSSCARADPFNPNFQETVKTCVRNSEELENVEQITDTCLDCYAISADCARMKCSAQCLAGDSVACDQCREDNKCTPNFYTCAGVPNPQ